eukprot:g14769.t1
MTVHRAPYALMEVFYNFLYQFVLPDFDASTWCSRDCSLTPVSIAAVNCQVGHPLRAEKVYSVELRTIFREFLSAVTWQNIYDATLFVPSLLGTRHSVRNQALPYHFPWCDGRWTRDQKIVGSTWTGTWCCPSCKLRFVELTKVRWITPDFRVFLPRDHPFPRDFFLDLMHLIWNLFQHFIRMTWKQTQAETNNKKSKGHKVKQIPSFHIRKKQAGEDFQEYQTAMREAKQKHLRDTKLSSRL